jgi:hypothetical protein
MSEMRANIADLLELLASGAIDFETFAKYVQQEIDFAREHCTGKR